MCKHYSDAGVSEESEIAFLASFITSFQEFHML